MTHLDVEVIIGLLSYIASMLTVIFFNVSRLVYREHYERRNRP